MSMPCPNENPCNCIKGLISQKAPTPTCGVTNSPKGTCLIACSDTLHCAEAVGPCGQTGTFDLSTLNHNTCGCSDPVNLKYKLDCIIDPGAVVSASIDRNTGILTWITGPSEYVGKYSDISFIIECASDCDNCLPLKSAGKFSIGVKDECIGNDCEDCDNCDPCTGDCKPGDIELTVNAK